MQQKAPSGAFFIVDRVHLATSALNERRLLTFVSWQDLPFW